MSNDEDPHVRKVDLREVDVREAAADAAAWDAVPCHEGDSTDKQDDACCVTLATPVRSSKGRLELEEESHDFRLFWLPVEYFRVRVLIGAIFLLVASLPALYTTPIVGLLLVPSAALTIYWTIDVKRFQAGGDIRAFVNRPCALMYLTVCGGASAGICIYDVVSLALTLSSSSDTPLATIAPLAADVGGEVDAVHTLHHSRGYFQLCIVVNSVLLVTLVYLLVVVRRLRKVLE